MSWVLNNSTSTDMGVRSVDHYIDWDGVPYVTFKPVWYSPISKLEIAIWFAKLCRKEARRWPR